MSWRKASQSRKWKYLYSHLSKAVRSFLEAVAYIGRAHLYQADKRWTRRLVSLATSVQFVTKLSLGSTGPGMLANGGSYRIASIDVGSGSERWLSELRLVKT